jgi:hypothetical protein
MASFHHGSKKSLAQALELFKKAIQLDPGFASPCAMAAWCRSEQNESAIRPELSVKAEVADRQGRAISDLWRASQNFLVAIAWPDFAKRI